MHPIIECAADLSQALKDVASVEPTFMSAPEKEAALVALTEARSQLDGLTLRVLAESDDVAAARGMRDPATWLAVETRTTSRAARRDLALARALMKQAARLLDRDEPGAHAAAAAARAKAAEAAIALNRAAVQMHGAIGFTQEHKLHHLTKRLWSWRDEAGSELAWSRVLAEGLLAEGPDGLWPALTQAV